MVGMTASLIASPRLRVLSFVKAAEGNPQPQRFCEVVAPLSTSEINKKRKKTQLDTPHKESVSEVVDTTQHKLQG